MREGINVVNTAVVSIVAVAHSREQKVRSVIDSFLGVGVCGAGSEDDELEKASWVLWFYGAADGEGRGRVNPIDGGRDGNNWLMKEVCRDKARLPKAACAVQ